MTRLPTLLVAAALVAAPGAVAQTAPAAPAGQPLGGPLIAGVCLLSREAIFANAKVARAANERLQQLATEAQAEVDAERKPLEEELKKFQAESAKLTAEQRTQREQALNARAQPLQAKAQHRAREIEATRARALGRISDEVQPVIAQVYRGKNCGLLLDRGSVLGGNFGNDLTPAVVQALDAKTTDFRSHAEVVFDGAAADKLAEGGDRLLDAVLDRAAVLTAAEMLGMASAAFDTTLAYLKQRVQFGQVLATFQALQHRMANLYSEIELMRSAVEAGLAAIDAAGSAGGDPRQAASLAKGKANEVGHLMSRELIQLHGGIGMTDEYDAGFTLKRMRVLEQMWGNAAYHRDRFARLGGF